jgi:hypothetical protein
VISGAETLPLKKSLRSNPHTHVADRLFVDHATRHRKREKTTNGYLAACDRCFSICFVDRVWDVEIDISADVDGIVLTQSSAVREPWLTASLSSLFY